ncbi:unnamed protein product [Nesidiocoris tenuis]|uniref:Uncharacterized protein n=1 Tax=Nesidiocoris tenuis TaxID=355587 RepID=A0A6H5HW26_9HEMI|nr:unnamed protein product [Nesidiocoris tenuis]
MYRSHRRKPILSTCSSGSDSRPYATDGPNFTKCGRTDSSCSPIGSISKCSTETPARQKCCSLTRNTYLPRMTLLSISSKPKTQSNDTKPSSRRWKPTTRRSTLLSLSPSSSTPKATLLVSLL